MSDFAIKALATVFWPLIVLLSAAVMGIGLILLALAWPLIPFTKVVRNNGKVILKI